jgi:ribosomal protein L24E
MAERCDCCGTELLHGGYWVQMDRRRFKFCSAICMNEYNPEIDHEIVI